MDQRDYDRQEENGYPVPTEGKPKEGFLNRLGKAAVRIKKALSVKDEFRVADETSEENREGAHEENVPEADSSPEEIARTTSDESASGKDTAGPIPDTLMPSEEILPKGTDPEPAISENDEPEIKGNIIGKFLGKIFKKTGNAEPEDPGSSFSQPEEMQLNEDDLTANMPESQPEPTEMEIPTVPLTEEITPMTEEVPPSIEAQDLHQAEKEECSDEGASGKHSVGLLANLMERILHRQQKPIDEVLEIKKLEKKFIEGQIKQRRRDEAKLLRKIRRSKRERKSLLDSLAKNKLQLKDTIATMKAREADVRTLEKQSLSLQGEIERDSARQGILSQEILASQDRLEQLKQQIAETEQTLQRVSSEYALRQSEQQSLNELMDKTRQRLDQMTAEVGDLDRRRNENENILLDLNSQIIHAEQSKQEMLQQTSQAAEENARTQKALDEKRHEVSVMETVAAELQKDIAGKQALLQDLPGQIESLKQAAEQNQIRAQQTAQELADLESQKVQTNQQIFQAKLELEKAEEQRRKHEAALERLSVELTNSNSLLVERNRQVSALDAGIAELKSDTEKKQEIIIQLQQKIESLRQSGLTVAQKIDELNKQKAETATAADAARSQLVALESTLKTKGAEIRGKEEELAALNGRSAKLEEEVRYKEQEHLNLSESITLALSSQEDLQKKLETTRHEQQTQSESLAKVNQQIDEAGRRYSGMLEEQSSLEADISRKKDELADWTGKLDSLKGSFAEMNQQLESNRRQSDELSVKIADQKGQIEALQRDKQELIGRLQTEKDELESRIASLHKKRSGLEQWIKEAMEFRNKQGGAIEEQLAKSRELKQQVAALDTRHKELSDNLEKGRRELEEIDSENQRLLQERARGIQTAESELAELSRQREEIRIAINQEQEREADLSKQGQDLNKEIDDLKGIKEALAFEVDEEQAKLDKVTADLNAATQGFEEKVQQQNRELESLAQETEASKQRLREQAEQIQMAVDERSRKLESIKDLLRGVEAEVESKEKQREELEKTLAELRSKNQEAEAQAGMEMASLDTKKESLRQEIENLAAEKDTAQGRLKDVQDAVAAKSAEEAALLKRFQMLSLEMSEMENMKKESRELSRKIDEQKRILEDLELQIDKKSGLFS